MQTSTNRISDAPADAEEKSLLDSVIENTRAEAVSEDALGAITRAEIDIQISTAKRFPRSIRTFLQRAREMATLSEDVAASCFYSLPRGGKPITGPSVRLAEICALAWGNIRYGARLVGDDGRKLTAQGFCHDLESNVASTIETDRRVTDKGGRRYSDDMVIVTGNAACAIAKRNAILSVVPRAYIAEVERAAREVAIGNAETLTARRVKMIDYFRKLGLEEKRICAAVGKTAPEDIGLEELGQLRGFATAIREGQTSIEDAFPELKESKVAAIKEKLANGTPEPAKTQPAKPAQPEENLERQDAARRIEEAIKQAVAEQELEAAGRELSAQASWLGKDVTEALMEQYRGQERLLKGKKRVEASREDW